MRRHAIITCLGEATKPRVTVPKDVQVVTVLPFVNNTLPASQRVSHDRLFGEMKRLGLQPPELAMDLLVLAVTIYAADTRISRSCDSQDGWTREIDLYVPVSDPGLWQKQRLRLEDLLRFLTGDLWRVFFRPRPSRLDRISPDTKKGFPYETDTICLFSGGLDSFTGAIDLLESGHRPILLGQYSSADVSQPQSKCSEFLQDLYPKNRPELLRAYTGIPKEPFDGVSEDSTRSRSFLFFALGAACAAGLAPQSRLVVPENGFISLNVPLTPLRLGAHSTRTTHPCFMAMFQSLLDALHLGVQMENPYRFETKGELLRGCGNQTALRKFAHRTMSCAHSAQGRYERQSGLHCGTCVPCLVRRAAFSRARIGDKTSYRHTLEQKRALNSLNSEGANIRAFQIAISRLEDDPERAEYEVYQSGPLADAPDLIPEYISVYRRGLAEVATWLGDMKVRPR